MLEAQPAGPSDEDAPPGAAEKKARNKEVLIVEEVQNLQANRELRRMYADKAYALASDCLNFLFALIAGNAIWAAISGQQVVSDKLLFALITGVTVNVLAAFLGVIRGIFPADNGQKKPKQERK
jgi:hypothetical protein